MKTIRMIGAGLLLSAIAYAADPGAATDKATVKSVTNTPTAAAEPVRFNNAKCPVMGSPIKANQKGGLFVVHEGIRYEMCCGGCPAAFKKDPEKFLAKLPNKGKIVELGNTVCPVEGGAVDKQYAVVYDGTKVLFCCAGCIAKFEDDPATYVKKAKEQVAEDAEPTTPVGPEIKKDVK